jgi:hypothetical protein
VADIILECMADFIGIRTRQRIMHKSRRCAPKHTPLFSRAEEATNSHYR